MDPRPNVVSSSEQDLTFLKEGLEQLEALRCELKQIFREYHEKMAHLAGQECERSDSCSE